jgi:hypothetical protein
VYDVRPEYPPAGEARTFPGRRSGYVPYGQGAPAPVPAHTQTQTQTQTHTSWPFAELADPGEIHRVVALRNSAMMRLREMSSRHGMHAYDQRNGADALGPHAVAFLYHDLEHRSGARPRDSVRAATRLFRDTPDVQDLPALLLRLAKIAGGYADKGPFDPRRLLAHRSDDMSGEARFIGVAVSTLDTLAGQWVDVRAHVLSALEVAGRSYIHLVDGTRLILDRGGQFGLTGNTYSSRSLEADRQMAFASYEHLRRDPQGSTEQVWIGLETLQHQVWRGLDNTATHTGRSRHRH